MLRSSIERGNEMELVLEYCEDFLDAHITGYIGSHLRWWG